MSARALPNELIEAILLQLPALHDSKESVQALCRFGEASSRFLTISRKPNIWHDHYVAQWQRCDSAHEEMRKANTQCGWREMYAARSRADRKALELLDSIITSPKQRDSAANEVAFLGYDVWQALFHQTIDTGYDLAASPDTDTPHTPDTPTQGLTKQYWAREVLGVISRARAINIWQGLSNPHHDVSFEYGLAALSAFFGADLDGISEEFDRLAESCQNYLATRGSVSPSNQTDLVIAICAWMRQEGFVKSDPANFHNLHNHFPHSVLFDKPQTLPISLVYVFVCIARRLKIDAYPVSFPQRVLAVVFPSRGTREGIFVDVFDSAAHPILSYSEDLPAMLLRSGIDPATLPQHSAPATTATMVLRAASNILQSLTRIMEWDVNDIAAAHYAAYCAALLLTEDQRLVPALFVEGIGGPLDRTIVFRGVLEKCLPEAARRELNLHLDSVNPEGTDDSTPRTDCRPIALYFIGMVFHHKEYRYTGLVKGWDNRCRAGDAWIQRMRVNDLPRGADQPFYRSFTTDGHTRYVAEDNIEPIFHPAPSEIRVLLKCNRTIGRWFDGYQPNLGRFILSQESRLMYPLDEAFGDTFVATHANYHTFPRNNPIGLHNRKHTL